MKLDVVATVEEIRSDQIINHVVIMIDVLRASSSIVTALAAGFQSIIPVETIGQAHLLRSEKTRLAGERHCKKISDFDFNNSPTELKRAGLTGIDLILTTTNGTRAIQKADRASHLLIGCFLNASACMRHALSFYQDVTLYCAGTRQEFALEDGLAAGLLVHLARQLSPSLQLSDFAETLAASYLYQSPQLVERLRQSTTGKRLVQHHFGEDIELAAQRDLYQLVPFVKEGRILPRLIS